MALLSSIHKDISHKLFVMKQNSDWRAMFRDQKAQQLVLSSCFSLCLPARSCARSPCPSLSLALLGTQGCKTTETVCIAPKLPKRLGTGIGSVAFEWRRLLVLLKENTMFVGRLEELLSNSISREVDTPHADCNK